MHKSWLIPWSSQKMLDILGIPYFDTPQAPSNKLSPKTDIAWGEGPLGLGDLLNNIHLTFSLGGPRKTRWERSRGINASGAPRGVYWRNMSNFAPL